MSNNTRNVESKGFSSHSMIDRKTCSYVWMIPSYRTNKNFKSRAFTGACDDFKWCLELASFGENGFVTVLFPDSKDQFQKYSPLSGNLKITLSNNDGTWYCSGEASFLLKVNEASYFIQLCIYDANSMNGLGSSNRLFVWCQIEYMKKARPFESASLSRDLERIRTDEDFSDATISVNGKNYPVHKVILAARSSVFKAMFRNDMLESQKNNVIIDDIKQETFEEMLRYIYTGEMRNLDEWAFELFPAADKYDLEELKKGCEGILITKLSADNVGKILVLADMHNAEELKTNALRFIKANCSDCEDFENTEIWKILTECRPSLMKDMLAVFFKK